jgi:WD40 repeat protein
MVEIGMGAPEDRPAFVSVSAEGAAVLSIPEQEGAAPCLWRADSTELARLVDPHPQRQQETHLRVVGAGFHPDGRIATGHRSGRVNLWTRDGQWTASLQSDTGSPDALQSLAVHPRGDFLVTGGRKAFRLWSWDAKRIDECTVSGYKVQLLRFNADGTRLLSVSDLPSDGNYVAEWWTDQGRRLGRLHWPGLNPWSRWWLGDEQHGLVAATEDTLYDALDPTQSPALLRASRGTRIAATAVDRDGGRIALLFSDGQLRVWNRGERRVTLRLRVASTGPLLFSADSRFLFVGLPDGRIEPHALELDTLFDAAAARLESGFSAVQIERFGLRAPVRLNALAAFAGKAT